MKLEKVTPAQNGRPDRWYDDACGTALAMELVGERWSMLIVRELMYGPRRFSEVRAGLPGISANTLTQRLTTLQRADILIRRTLPPPASVQVYELTPWGYESEPAIMALGRWAARSPLHDPTLFLSGASLMMSMRTMLVAERIGDLAGRIGVRLGEERFVATLGGGRLEITRGDAPDVAARIEVDRPWPLLCVIYGHEPIPQWEAEGLQISGDRALAERFAGLFQLPAKVDKAAA
jgi:DNA-binding HxlR family transcriptional regulator